MKNGPNNKYVLIRRVLLTGMAAVIFFFAGGFNQFCLQDAEAIIRDGSCGNNKLCKELEGKEFDQIRYSSMGSEIVVLYSMNQHGDLKVFERETRYTREKGTVNDAIEFLSSHSEYGGFRILKARKTTGWFSAEIIDGMYIVEPEYIVMDVHVVPEYSISEKDGQFTVYLRVGFQDRKISDLN